MGGPNLDPPPMDESSSSDDRTLPLPGYGDADEPMPERIGVYPVTGVLGRGGMGTVFAAQDTALHRRIAIKVLPDALPGDSSLIQRFRREARLLAALDHPNIATIYSLEESEGRQFITMELVPGRTLAAQLAEHSLSWRDTLIVARQIARGLEVAHRRGIIHRDLKPLNIMITPEGRVKILDFGLALTPLVEEGTDQPVLGTPGYMSPEQARGERVDARADTWALGCILYECVTGEKYIGGDTPAERLVRTMDAASRPPTLSDEHPLGLRDLVARCLERDVDARIGDATRVRREIEEVEARTRATIARARPTVRSNLPVQLSSFVGRGREVAEVEALIADHRLVTLTGFGGSGKTRLGVEVAANRAREFPDGVWFVDLSAASPIDSVARAAARALALKEQPSRSVVDVLGDFLRPRRSLVILDNCEQVLGAAAELATALLQTAPELVVVATSREPLGSPGEVVFRVDPLPVPGDTPAAAVDIAQVDAVRLFVERAHAADARFALSDGNARAVAAVCRRLDGIPLGLELAAAKVRAFGVEEIADRLRDEVAAPSSSRASPAARHETLRSLIEWSHDLLRPNERVVFRRLAVFAGGWTMEAAEAVAGGDGIEPWEVSDIHSRLVDKSLVTMDAGPLSESERTRYRMLEVVGEYAGGRLRESGERDEMRRRHRDAFIELAETAEPHMRGFEQARWFSRLESEHENLRLAFEACGLAGEEAAALGARLAGSLGRYWMVQGHWSEGREACTRVLDATSPHRDSIDVARTLNAAGNLAFHQGDYADAQRHHRRALYMRRRLGDGEGQGNSLNNLGEIARVRGASRRARVLYEAALAVQLSVGDVWGEAVSHNNLGELAQAAGDYSRARTHHDRALALWPELGDRWGVAWSLSNLGYVSRKEGELADATSCYERSLSVSREINDRFGVALSLHALGELARDAADHARAGDRHREALELRRELGDRNGIAESLEAFARLAADVREYERAAELLGAAEAVWERIGAAPTGERDREIADLYRGLGDVLGSATTRAARGRGRSMFVDEALRCALAVAEESKEAGDQAE